MNNEAITARVEARNAADMVHHLASDEAVRFTGDAALAFWRRVLESVCAVLPPEYHPTRVAAMTDEEAREFKKERVPFGKFKTYMIKDVPLDDLCWIDEQPDFRRQVNRYLRNPQIQDQQAEDG